jgi:ribonuclease HI
MIFTDGSKDEEGVGAAYVGFINGREIAHKRFRLASYCSAYQAELLAIQRAVNWLVGAGHMGCSVIIATDSRSALEGLEDLQSRDSLIVDIRRGISILSDNGVRTEFGWVRGHSGTLGNERADCLAREAAKMKSGIVYDKFPLSFAGDLVRKSVREKHQKEYTEAPQGAHTKELFPTLELIRRFEKRNGWSFQLTQALTGHGAFKKYLHKYKILESGCCQCDGEAIQSVNHLLFECGLLNEERNNWQSVCRKEGIEWSMEGIKDAIIKDIGLRLIGDSMKEMVKRAKEMNDEII